MFKVESHLVKVNIKRNGKLQFIDSVFTASKEELDVCINSVYGDELVGYISYPIDSYISKEPLGLNE